MKIEEKKLSLLIGGILVAVAVIIVFVYGLSSRKEVKEERQGEGVETSANEVSKTLSHTDIAKAREYFEKGIQFSLKKEYDAAIEEYKKSLQLNPFSAEVHSNLGFAYLDKKDNDNAILEQKKALELDPTLANGYYGLAFALEKKNDTEGAIQAWKAYLNLAQPHSRWWIKAKERLDNLEKQKKGS